MTLADATGWTPKDKWTVAVAVAAFVLGIVNLIWNIWRETRKERVRLRIVPSLYYWTDPPKNSAASLHVRIINKSATITAKIESVQVRYGKGKDDVFYPHDYTPFPAEIKPKDSLVVRFFRNPKELYSEDMARLRRIEVETADGQTLKRRSKALRLIRRNCHHALVWRAMRPRLRVRLSMMFGLRKRWTLAEQLGLTLPPPPPEAPPVDFPSDD